MHDEHPDQADCTPANRATEMRFVCDVTLELKPRISSDSDRDPMGTRRVVINEQDGTTGARTALPDIEAMIDELEELDSPREDVVAAMSRSMEEMERAKQEANQ